MFSFTVFDAGNFDAYQTPRYFVTDVVSLVLDFHNVKFWDNSGGFRGGSSEPPCSLAKFIFNETAAVQGTIIRAVVMLQTAYKPSCSCYKG